jgi:hypothetical protein
MTVAAGRATVPTEQNSAYGLLWPCMPPAFAGAILLTKRGYGVDT